VRKATPGASANAPGIFEKPLRAAHHCREGWRQKLTEPTHVDFAVIGDLGAGNLRRAHNAAEFGINPDIGARFVGHHQQKPSSVQK
jgi:hypothetical protein